MKISYKGQKCTLVFFGGGGGEIKDTLQFNQPILLFSNKTKKTKKQKKQKKKNNNKIK